QILKLIAALTTVAISRRLSLDIHPSLYKTIDPSSLSHSPQATACRSITTTHIASHHSRTSS
uniref:Uncharacterized protein n=1 Tax=Aegilops tauschii subsp. strangulata TaxID=200361 RepID=A0A452XWD8_AEGTS